MALFTIPVDGMHLEYSIIVQSIVQHCENDDPSKMYTHPLYKSSIQSSILLVLNSPAKVNLK